MRSTSVGALFHGQCEECKVKHSPSYKSSKEGFKIFDHVNHAGNPYFQVSSKIVFEMQLLEDISNNIWVSEATSQNSA